MRLIASGTRLGQYEVVGQLGSGGMGDVYRARDTRLDRHVAVKVLPEDFARDPDRVARFQREAKTLASLNHPHIAVIHDFHESGGVSYLVLELVEGETLAERIARGPIPPTEAIAIGIQIADAFEAAHDKNIVHRDLKPANIKITPEEVVKVLDFGLARWTQPGIDPADASNSPTIGVNPTGVGVIMGTAAYMSPEQARGRPVDERTDIWAFGCVLYEMLTGKQTFSGEDVTDIIASVIKGEPDWNRLHEDVPPNLRLLLRRCLDKNPKARLRSIADARIFLEEARNDNSAAAAVSLQRQPRWAKGISAALLLIVVVLAGALLFRKPVPAGGGTKRVLLGLTPAEHLDADTEYIDVRPSRTAMAFSPDGQTVVYAAVTGDLRKLYRRPLEQLNGIPIEGTDDARNPFFSPDGQSVGFLAKGKLRKVPLNGGPVVDICAVSGLFYGATWGPGRTVVFAQGDGNLTQVSADGGEPQLLIAPNKAQHESAYLLPRFLPGGKAILFTIAAGKPEGQVAVYVFATHELHVLISADASDARYVSTGHLVYMASGKLMAVPFVLSSLQVTGPPVAVVDDVMHALHSPSDGAETWAGQFDISEAGDLLYATGGAHPLYPARLVWVDRRGQVTPIAQQTDFFGLPRISPDGLQIALNGVTENRRPDIWLYDIKRGTSIRLTHDEQSGWPIWRPKWKQIVFIRSEDTVALMADDGSGTPETLPELGTKAIPAAWTPDGNQLLYFKQIGTAPRELWRLPMAGDRNPTLVLKPAPSTHIEHPEFSPDGRWLSYTSDESGRDEVYIQPFPTTGEKTRVSTDTGQAPTWSRTSHELFYLRDDPKTKKVQMWAVDVRVPGAPGSPHFLFEGDFVTTMPLRDYDVTADGQRFVMNQKVESPDKPVTHLVLVQNWFDELKRRVPSAR